MVRSGAWRWALLVVLGSIGAGSGRACAAIVLTLTEEGGDVVVKATGSANLAGLRPIGTGTFATLLNPSRGMLVTGATTSPKTTSFEGLTGPAMFGPGGFQRATSGSGAQVGITTRRTMGPVLVLPEGYVSGSPLEGTSTFANQTLAGLGLMPGTYTYTWGEGDAKDTLTVRVGTAAANPVSPPPDTDVTPRPEASAAPPPGSAG